MDWCSAYELSSGNEFFLPHLFVSLDFTLMGGNQFERSSAGLAIGTCEEEAIETGLLEVLERDAIGEWQRCPVARKAKRRIALASIPFDWFHEWNERVKTAGATLRVFATETIIGTPVCIVYLSGYETFGASRRVYMGSCAHGNPELSLFKALAEALQSRLTVIAGSRDDIMPSLYEPGARGTFLGGAEFGGVLSDFRSVNQCNSRPEIIADRLAALGYDKIAVKRLSPPDSIPVVKAFVPGLGSLHRKRRRPG